MQAKSRAGIDSTRLTLARRAEQQAVQLAKDVKTLTSGSAMMFWQAPPLPHRQELFDFIVAELRCREVNGCLRIRSLCVALQNNGMTYFCRTDEKLVEIAQRFDTPLPHSGCLLHRRNPPRLPTGLAGINSTINFPESFIWS